jgi:hypothetical protein
MPSSPTTISTTGSRSPAVRTMRRISKSNSGSSAKNLRMLRLRNMNMRS